MSIIDDTYNKIRLPISTEWAACILSAVSVSCAVSGHIYGMV